MAFLNVSLYTTASSTSPCAFLFHHHLHLHLHQVSVCKNTLIERACQDLLFPNCGYSSETGGKMKNLRTLTNAQVTRYHGENYRPENAMLLVTGLVEEDAFLKYVYAISRIGNLNE